MRKLRLVGLSADGQQVVFVDESGAEFGAPADDRLRAALRGDRARLGQLEIEMDSALRPRDIQARIRAGETPEAVANLAQVSVDKIMPYCVPVLAERQHVAALARRSHVRRKNAEGPARRLNDIVSERLRERSIDPEAAAWDAWRRDDGRWSIGVTYRSGEHERSARFTFDSIGRYSLADDDEAKWLTGERQASKKGPQPRDGEGAERSGRRLSAVPDDSDDLLSLTQDEADGDELTAVVRAVSRTPPGEHVEDHQDDEPADEPTDSETGDEADGADAGAAGDGSSEPETEATPHRRRRTGRRASVPSWDEIMFGKSKDS
ncbi:MAG: septation protein SepH [Nocardioidaceae bacterium]